MASRSVGTPILPAARQVSNPPATPPSEAPVPMRPITRRAV